MYHEEPVINTFIIPHIEKGAQTKQDIPQSLKTFNISLFNFININLQIQNCLYS